MSATTAAPQDERLRAPSPAREHERANISDVEKWASLVGGGALLAYGLTRGSWRGMAIAATGGGLIARGATKHCPVYERLGVDTAHADWSRGNVIASIMPARTIEVERAVTIERPRQELYVFWRHFANLPRFMEHLERVDVIDDTHSHWVAKSPVGGAVEWDAEITDELENELIAWRSTRDSTIKNAGSVRFTDAPAGRGTVVKVDLRYEAPAGRIGAAFARLLGENPEQQIREDLRHFKQVMEAGETPTVEGQPTGPR
ncbi:MAG TPA: SRPBCC family protein [Gemmatimonadaceae bacterium]